MNRLLSLRSEDLGNLADPRVVARGRECVRWGLLSDLTERQGQIEARVAERHGQACRVLVREGSRGLVTSCTCPQHVDHGETCKHIVAALVAWISRRDGGSSNAPAGEGEEEGAVSPTAEAIQSLRSLIRLVIAKESGTAKIPSRSASVAGRRYPLRGRLQPPAAAREPERPDPSAMLAALLPPDVPIKVVVNRGGHTHGLTVAFARDEEPRLARGRRRALRGARAASGDEGAPPPAPEPAVTLTIPPGDVGAALRELDALDRVTWSDAADSLRVYYSPVRMRLHADYAKDGVLVLSPVAVVREGRAHSRTIEPVHLHERIDGTIWVEDGADTLRRVGLWTALLEQYAPDFKPRVLEGHEVVEFLSHGQDVGWREGLDPSDRVRASRVFDDVHLARVNVSEGPGGWLFMDPVYRAGDHSLPLAEILEAQRTGGLVRRGDDWILIRGGATWARGARPRVTTLAGVPLPGSGESFSYAAEVIPEGAELIDGRIRASRLAYLRQRAEWGPEVEIVSDPALARFEAFLRREGPPVKAPKIKGMIGKLRPYQHDGYRWLWFLREASLGGILADEMGLGKTHQVMALLLAVYAAPEAGAAAGEKPGPSLVVCPRSVLDHWETKVRAHAPSLDPLVYHGHEREREREALLKRRLVVTTYGILARDIDHLTTIPWEHVILDEAQQIKNAATKSARAARKLQARHRLVLTGTPIENHLEELRSITDFVLPGYLGSAEAFRKRFARPIETGDEKAMLVLKRAIEPFKMRRLKSQVLTDLPAKIEDTRYAALTPHQSVLYAEVLSRAKASGLFDALRDPGKPVDFIHVFSILSRLKRLCDHPALILDGKPTRHLTSGKFELFKEVLGEALEAGEKVVVFSQYLEMLDMIEEHLDALGVKHSGLRGQTRRRGAAIKLFQEDESCRVFVASLLAGGLGIDLTAASVVIHYDRWWNAAREDQATDRVHRIGQMRGVQVFRLITKGTLEERIDQIIREKRKLADFLVEADPALGLKALTREDLLRILMPVEAGATEV